MRCGPMNKNYYLLTNLLTEEETKIITSIIRHIENDERRIGVQQIANENYVSPTYIIKMCKRLGFEGYSELYYHLQQTANANDRSSGAALQELIDNYDEEKGRRFCELLRQFQNQKLFADGSGFSGCGLHRAEAGCLRLYGVQPGPFLRLHDFP